MIHIDEKDSPADFHQRVRRPGQLFLRSLRPRRRPTAKQWQTHAYWRQVAPELHDIYGGICAYSCHWIPYDTGADTVEHFRPKKLYPSRAYDWSNYRLVCSTLNGRKGAHEDVLDPFLVEDGWFVIDFPSMLVKPHEELSPARSRRVEATIKRLGLNDEGTCLKSRVNWLRDYCTNDISFDYLRRKAPFIVSELERQGLSARIRGIFII
jgi:uncharacterized protein (TIGR02646 family)